MTSQQESTSTSPTPRPRRRRVGWTIRITPTGILVLVIINLLILTGWAYAIRQVMARPDSAGILPSTSPSDTSAPASATSIPASVTSTRTPTASATTQPSDTPSQATDTASPQPIGTLAINQGLIILALDEGGNTHIFAYQPEQFGEGLPMPLTRLTNGPWDDIYPAISADGQTIAFASNRSGYWDIYLMDLSSGGVTRLTDTLQYDGAPAWSPDAQWLVYETYFDENLELQIQSVTNPGDAFLLTNNPASDFSPAWSPQGRQIAFISNQDGENEVWLADLDKSDEQRFYNLSKNPKSKETHPVWAPDGASLLWVAEQDGIRNLYVNDISIGNADEAPSVLNQQNLGSGDWPAWSADGEYILTTLQAPNRIYLTAYRSHYPGLVLPALELPGAVHGLDWSEVELVSPLHATYQQMADFTATPLYTSQATAPGEGDGERRLVQLVGVQAPQPYLHEENSDSFQAMRSRVAVEAGWDFLSNLENAYVPLTSPLDPGMGNSWLYTGRAFTIDTTPMGAGWLAVVREDFGADTYWRVYLRPLYQDGSAGLPLHELPWDFDSRYNGDTNIYEQGGIKYTFIPTGYWIDFTERARAYGWDRLPALTTWRASYPAARFSEFVLTGNQDWQSAMLELYPPEILVTPSPVVPPTRTPTPTSRWYVSPTPTVTPSPRPTFTPGQPTLVSTPAAPGG